MQFRVAAYNGVDRSMNPADYVDGKRFMIPRPAITQAIINSARRRTFDFGRANGTFAGRLGPLLEGEGGFYESIYRDLGIAAKPVRSTRSLRHSGQ